MIAGIRQFYGSNCNETSPWLFFKTGEAKCGACADEPDEKNFLDNDETEVNGWEGYPTLPLGGYFIMKRGKKYVEAAKSYRQRNTL